MCNCACIEGSRHGPYNVTVEMEDTTATIRWKPAFDSGHPLHHVVWYERSSVFYSLIPSLSCHVVADIFFLLISNSVIPRLHDQANIEQTSSN